MDDYQFGKDFQQLRDRIEDIATVLASLKGTSTAPLRPAFAGAAAKRRHVRQSKHKGVAPVLADDNPLPIGEWFPFENCVVNNQLGNQLLGTQGATQISFYADHIYWQYREDDSSTVVTTPNGTNVPGTAPGTNFVYGWAHQYSIVVWGSAVTGSNLTQWQQEVDSTSPDNPLKIVFSSTGDWFTNVNDQVGGYNNNSGAYDLWVRVDAR